jgi:hypothetical protein
MDHHLLMMGKIDPTFRVFCTEYRKTGDRTALLAGLDRFEEFNPQYEVFAQSLRNSLLGGQQ